jgi:hypothetical protein
MYGLAVNPNRKLDMVVDGAQLGHDAMTALTNNPARYRCYACQRVCTGAEISWEERPAIDPEDFLQREVERVPICVRCSPDTNTHAVTRSHEEK